MGPREKGPRKDVFPIEHGDIPASYFSFTRRYPNISTSVLPEGILIYPHQFYQKVSSYIHINFQWPKKVSYSSPKKVKIANWVISCYLPPIKGTRNPHLQFSTTAFLVQDINIDSSKDEKLCNNTISLNQSASHQILGLMMMMMMMMMMTI